MNIMEFIKSHLIIVITIVSLITIFLYSIFCVTINKLNKVKYGRTTWVAWIPIFNIYLLGKLTIHMIIGLILAIGFFFTIGFSLTNNGIEQYYSILPRNIQEPYVIVYSAIVVILAIYAYFKAKNMIANGDMKSEVGIFSTNGYSNLNRPFIEKKIIDNNTETKIDNSNIENTIEDEETKKISLTSLSSHHNDETESYEKIFNENNPKN